VPFFLYSRPSWRDQNIVMDISWANRARVPLAWTASGAAHAAFDMEKTSTPPMRQVARHALVCGRATG
jgi:hypothetical protein